MTGDSLGVVDLGATEPVLAVAAPHHVDQPVHHLARVGRPARGRWQEEHLPLLPANTIPYHTMQNMVIPFTEPHLLRESRLTGGHTPKAVLLLSHFLA